MFEVRCRSRIRAMPPVWSKVVADLCAKNIISEDELIAILGFKPGKTL
jgi:hypothetical protein